MSAARSEPTFVPALGHDWLTPFYDAVAWLLGDTTMKRRLIAQAAIAPGHDVLDLGCGTGTLALMIKRAHPSAHVSGVDIDPKILAMARAKLVTEKLDVRFVEGSATAPPFPPASFDRVVTSLVLHHLTTPQKRAALAAVRGLLRPGGELHVADWGKPQNLLMRVAALGFQLSDGAETTGANVRGELPSLIAEAGFADVREMEHHMTVFGTLTYLSARVA
jgi:ubiquinone/menaquinone biosynthesis C-methylase UbiE